MGTSTELAELAELATLGAPPASSTRGRMPDSLGRWLRFFLMSSSLCPTGWLIQGRLLLNCHHLKVSFSISSESDKNPCYIDCIVACGLAGCFTVYFPFQCTISSS